MLSWKGAVWHIGVGCLLPAYLAVRTLYNQQYWHDYSPVRMALLTTAWVWYVYFMHVSYFTSPLKHLPSPRAGDRFFWGHQHIMRQQVPLTSAISAHLQDTPNEGLIALYGLFHSGPTIFVTNPDTVTEMLSTRAYDWHKPSADTTFLERILGNGLVTAEGSDHKSMRRSVAPAFAGKYIRDLVPLFYQKASEFVHVLAKKTESPGGSVVEVTTQLSHVTLDIIGLAGIGTDLDTIHKDDNRLAKLYEIIIDPDRGPIIPFFLIMVYVPPFLVERLYGTKYAKVARAVRDLRSEIRQLVLTKKSVVSKEKQEDIIDRILASGHTHNEYLCNQLLTFFAAGHETTASAMTWALYMLSLHPQVQDRLREECEGLIDDATQLDTDLLDQLPYLSAVCQETLRLYPPVPVTARQAVVDTKLKDTRVPKGTQAVISLWNLNRSPTLWGQNAAEFCPERWLSGERADFGGAQDSRAFSTFLCGPRSCIGQNFAKSEMKCLLLALILQFHFELAEPDVEVQITGIVSIRPANGLRLRLVSRRKGQVVLSNGGVVVGESKE